MVSEESNSKVIPVRVAVRIRPLVTRELREGCRECLDVSDGSPQVVINGTDKAFTFDYTYPANTSQGYVYESAVKNVVKNLFKGYNVTVVAYGQTGSGKTHSMGTAHVNWDDDDDETGIIPRAVSDIFEGITDHNDSDFLVKVSFIELYKETLFDLLSNKSRDECAVDIREDAKGGIKIVGLTEIPVTTLKETMKCLEKGALNRATGATAMNARSSRSHAIFSLHIEQRVKGEGENIICAKFHLVDLAGSERAKKTGATGERFKEGVNINRGLLALGNVISALCEEGHRGHIPYRDSKLTRLLQDSLGGNSHTVMLACVSPADSNLEETLSTLRYADRARKIKNKPIVNRDPQAAELSKLRQQVQQLQVQLLASSSGSGGFSKATNDEVNSLLSQLKAFQDENDKLTRALQTALDENTNMAEKALLAENARDRLKTRLEELSAQTGNTVDMFNKTLDVSLNPQFGEQINLVKELQSKVLSLQNEQKKNDTVMMEHELSRHNVGIASSLEIQGEANLKRDNNLDEKDVDTTEDSPSKQFGTAYTLRQAKLNEELQDLNKALVMKEELMNKMSVNNTEFLTLRVQHEKEKKDLECHIDILSKEKDELQQQLRAASHGNTSNKIAEQRRKRVQELEAQITEMKKKQKEQAKLIRVKEQSEHKVNKLSSEIQGMKATRVKLIRQMKEDNEKFRVWKSQKDKEVARLKEQDRRKQYQIVKMERMHSKQQNVLRRKMEEAVSINKRLKDAMAVQKAGAEKRAASKDVNSTSSRIRSWLEGELEVVTVKKQAKLSLATLVEDRKTISEQINKIKRQLSNGGLTAELTSDLETKKRNLEEDLQLRTAQISDLQSKIMDDEEEVIMKKRFDSLQSMIESKCAASYLFEMAVNNQVNCAARETDLKDLQASYEEVTSNLEELESEMGRIKELHQAELTRISQEHEDKVLFLLRQMPTAQDSDSEIEDENQKALLERLKFQEAEIARLSSIHEELQAKTQECEELKKELTVSAVTHGKRVSLLPTLDAPNEQITERRRTYMKAAKKKVPVIVEPITESEQSDDNADDDENDPDWRKTPLFRKIRQLTRGQRISEEKSDDGEEDVRKKSKGTKRDSSGEIKCGCKGDCMQKLCKCRKNSTSCGAKCKCNALKCKNTKSPDNSPSDSSNQDTLLNSTFDVGGIANVLQEKNTFKRPRLNDTVTVDKDSDIRISFDFENSPA